MGCDEHCLSCVDLGDECPYRAADVETIEVRRVLGPAAARELIPRSAPDLPPLDLPRPCRLIDADTGEPLAIVDTMARAALGDLRRALLSYPCDTAQVRGAGIRVRSRSFGFLARQPVLQRNVCCAAEGAKVYPDAHATIADAASFFAELLRLHYPEQYARNLAIVADVRPEWVLPGGLWTSGVVNETSALPYHYDRNNFDGAWSAMPVVRRHVRGGHLSLPELSTLDGHPVVLPCADGDIHLFYAQGLVHGVTPWRRVKPDGYRLSAVYYAVRRMGQCLSWGDELARSAASRTEVEDTMLEHQRADGFLDS